MIKKVLIIVILVLIISLFVLIRPEFTGKISEIKSSVEPKREIGDKRIKLVSTTCTDGKLTMGINNYGNATIDKNELKVFINEEKKTANFINKGIEPGETVSYSDLVAIYSGKLNIKVEGPDNTIGWGISC